jgi:phospholipid/cholesterol/gamma-HCH transport system substrate-binding protein/paraquat-inducible protein B
MSAKTGHFKIGLFVVVAAGLAVGGLVALGAVDAFRPKILAETYLDESVQGLERGSPVKYRGVQIGSVESIDFVGNVYPVAPDDHTHGRFIMVRLALRPVALRGRQPGDIEHMVKDGLRVRLASAGLTGVGYLEVDYVDPERNPPMAIAWTPATLYVPSAPSTAVRMTDAVERVLGQVEDAELDQVASETRKLVASLTKLITEELTPALKDLGATTREMPGTMAEFKKVAAETEGLVAKIGSVVDRDLAPAVANLNAAARDLAPAISNVNAASRELAPAIASIGVVARELPGTVAQVNRTLKRFEAVTTSQQDAIEESVESLRTVSGNLRELSDVAKRYPSHVFFGDPPVKK